MESPTTLLAHFLTAKEAAGRSPRTLTWYRDQITVYLDWLAQQPTRGWAAPSSVEQYLVEQRRAGLRPNTVAARYRALRVWFGWLLKRKIIAASPMSEIDKPKVPKIVVPHVQLEELRRLYQSIRGEGWIDHRDRLLLMLLFWTGLRVSEAVNLRVADVDMAARLITVRSGKGGQDRLVPYAPELGPLLLSYLMARPPYDSDAIFLASDGYGGVRGLLTAEGVRQMLRRRTRAAGLRHMHPHQFRHGFAMTFLNAGMQLSAVSEALGHSSERVTAAIYAQWLTEGLSRAYEETRRKLEACGK